MNIQELTKLIYENGISELKKHQDNGVDFSIVDSHSKGNLLISYSTYGYNEHYTQSEMVEFLLESGIDVNYQPNGRDNGKSALHKAAANGHFELLSALVENGANVEIKDKNGNTPLWNCVMMCRGNETQIEIIKYLISKGGALETKNNHGISPKDIINDLGLGIDKGNNQKDWDLRFLLS